jgi:hypothetical protein
VNAGVLAGKYQARAGSAICDECVAGKHKPTKPLAGINTACDDCQSGKYKPTTGVNTADNCEAAGKYSAALGVYLLAIYKHTPARTRAHKHARADTICMCG